MMFPSNEFESNEMNYSHMTREYEKGFYQVFECCNPDDHFSYNAEEVLFQSNDLSDAHGFAYRAWQADNSRIFAVIQPYNGDFRGGYGFPPEEEEEFQEDVSKPKSYTIEELTALNEEFMESIEDIGDDEWFGPVPAMTGQCVVEFLEWLENREEK